MDRTEILENANKIIAGERKSVYGDEADNFGAIADMWNAYLGDKLTKFIDPVDVANMMILLKIARIKSVHGKKDNWIDICGYAALGGEIEEEEEMLLSK